MYHSTLMGETRRSITGRTLLSVRSRWWKYGIRGDAGSPCIAAARDCSCLPDQSDFVSSGTTSKRSATRP
ncbi:hypothetical protein B0G57_10382 [Trinickia symbiotica]|nr:hypothetical protein B0G57_10382 [Trinickia symbiotica]